jgi:hypothetical protein
MDRALCFLGGAAVGAVTMYYFDPDRGRARRAACEDEVLSLGQETTDAVGKAGRDFAQRAR